jgi:hypothetical protein
MLDRRLLRGDGDIAQVESRCVHEDSSTADGRDIAACLMLCVLSLPPDSVAWAEGVSIGAIWSFGRGFPLYESSSLFQGLEASWKDPPCDEESGSGLL